MGDFHKPGIYGKERVCANAGGVFRRSQSRRGRGRRGAVDSWCVLRGGISCFSFERTRPAARMRPPCLIYLSTSNEPRPRQRTDRGCFLPIGKKPLHTVEPSGCHHFTGLSVCLRGCVYHSSSLLIARAVQGRFPQTRDLWKRATMG